MGYLYLASLAHYIPEALMCVTMIGLLFVESTYGDREKGKHFVYWTAYLGLAATFFVLVGNLSQDGIGIFTNAVVIDPFSTFAKILMVLGTFGAILLNRTSHDVYENVKSEFVVLAVGVLVGGMLLASANNMLILYIAIETLSILSYALASLKKNDERSSEAGLKYSLYGGVSAGIMLFGMSHIFGVLGTIQFTEMGSALAGLSNGQIAILLPSFLMFFAGIGYKISCFPFHMWTPDVYEGSPLPVTTFFSIVPKIAGVVALVRISHVFFGAPDTMLSENWLWIIKIAAALTMTVGNMAAINQKSIKRMLAYSSISHAGFMLLGVLVISDIGTRAILFYGTTYVFMTLVAFYITAFVQDKYGNDYFERFNGLMSRYPLMAIAMCITMFSLAGLPPLSGFVAKFNILAAVVKSGHVGIAVIAGINSVISLYYYLKIVRLMVFKPQESDEEISGFGFKNQATIVLFSAPVVALGIFWSKIMAIAGGAKILIQ